MTPEDRCYQNIILRLRALKLPELEVVEKREKWQTGKPPKDGWYWVKWFGSPPTIYKYEVGEGPNDLCKWSGPLNPPEGRE